MRDGCNYDPITPKEAIETLSTVTPKKFENCNIISTINFLLIQEMHYLDQKNRESFLNGQEAVQIRVDRVPFRCVTSYVSVSAHGGEFDFDMEGFMNYYGWIMAWYINRGWRVALKEGTTYPFINFLIDKNFVPKVELLGEITDRFKLMDMEQ